MKTAVVAILLQTACCLGTPLFGQSVNSSSQPGANLEAELARIDDERRNAYLQNDAATLDRILADDVTAVAGIGTEGDKASILADVRSHDLMYTKLTYGHRKIRIYGDTAVVTSHAEVVANYKERELSGKLLVTRVYAKQEGNWKLVAIQSTRIPEQMSVAARDTEAELRAVMTELHKAALAGDTETTISLMTDEYVQTDIAGHFQEKAEWLNTYSRPLAELIKAGKFHWEVYEEKDVQVRTYKDAAVVMGTLELKGTGARWGAQHTWMADPDAHLSATLRFTRVFIRRNGKWLLAAIHNALLSPPPATGNSH